MTAVTECDHESQTYTGTDTEAAPDYVYVEWRCDDCGARISDVYEETDRKLIYDPETEETHEVTDS